MCATCISVRHMPKMIQIRNVPDDLHHELRLRALKEGVSLSEYLLRLARRDLAKPTMTEWLARIEARGPLGDTSEVSAAQMIREDRDSHG